MDPTRALVSPSGDILINESTLPEARPFDGRELTALVGGILRFLGAVHGPEAVQLVLLHAEQVEAEMAPEGARPDERGDLHEVAE